VTLVQYRDKTASNAERRARAAALVAACHQRKVPLIVNDTVKLALEVGAAGVHLGRDDGDLVGGAWTRSVQSRDHRRVLLRLDIDRARRLAAAGADYVAFVQFYASPTKPHARALPAGPVTPRQRGPCPAASWRSVASPRRMRHRWSPPAPACWPSSAAVRRGRPGGRGTRLRAPVSIPEFLDTESS
jgi:hypothetical protein